MQILEVSSNEEDEEKDKVDSEGFGGIGMDGSSSDSSGCGTGEDDDDEDDDGDDDDVGKEDQEETVSPWHGVSEELGPQGEGLVGGREVESWLAGSGLISQRC